MDPNATNVSSNAEEDNASEITFLVQLCLYATVTIVGSLGNCLVCLAIYRQKKRRPNEFFIINLALTDIGAIVFSIPLDLTELLKGTFPLGQFMCHVVYPVQTILMGTSVFTLLCLSTERYRAIVTPLKPRVEVHTAFGMIVATWLFSMAAVSPYASILHLEDGQCLEKWPREIYAKSFTMSMFLLLYFIPLLIISGNYIRVMQKLMCEKKQIRRLFSESKDRPCKHAKKRAEQNIKVVKVSVIAVVAFAFCLLPNHALWLWHDFGEGKHSIYFNKFVVFCNIMVYINSAINPFIFGKITLKTCCHSADNERKRYGVSFFSKFASKGPSLSLRARALSDVTTRLTFFKQVQQEWQVDTKQEVISMELNSKSASLSAAKMENC